MDILVLGYCLGNTLVLFFNCLGLITTNGYDPDSILQGLLPFFNVQANLMIGRIGILNKEQ